MPTNPTPIIAVRNLCASSGSDVLFEDASLSLGEGSRAGLVGTNGSGKSTLLKILAGIVAPEGGDLICRTGKLIEYVPQFVPPELVRETLLDSFISKISSSGKDIEEWRAYEMLSLLKLSDSKFQVPLGSLSGGEANRALLGLALVVQPDFLLLDEPTNHMDSESIIFFERLLREELKRPFCIVSHDRDLLDSATSETFFIRDKGIYHFRLPYSEAVEALQASDEAARNKRSQELREIARLKASSDRLRGWVKANSNRAPALRNMVGKMERLQNSLTFVSRGNERAIGVDAAQLRINSAVRIPSLSLKTPDGRHLYSIEHLTVFPGDRAVILGPNGAGKTTLLRAINAAFKSEDSEEIKLNPQVSLGYYDQDLKGLDPSVGMFDYLRQKTEAGAGLIRKELIASGFPYRRHSEKIGVLSGGEKARLQFLELKLQRPAMLLLDEPTNHIDVDGIEDLERELSGFAGACILVSHDRRFVNVVGNRFFLIDEGKLREIESVQPYYGLLARRSLEDDTDLGG